MSDLGAIFHVKKEGTQYDAHAYTTEDECPNPNLKIKTKDGTQAYVKLTDNGSGDVPLRVKPKSSGTTYQVKTVAIPTGSVTIPHTSLGGQSFMKTNANAYEKLISLVTNYVTFTVPSGITVVQLTGESDTVYVGVTPKKTYSVAYADWTKQRNMMRYHFYSTFSKTPCEWGYKCTTISWSPEINKQTPTVTDY